MSTANRVLVLDETVLSVFSKAILSEEWFADFVLSDHRLGIGTARVGDAVFVLSDRSTENSRLIVIDLRRVELLPDKPFVLDKFFRILTYATSQFQRTVSVPMQWGTFHQGSRLSFFAHPMGRGTQARLYVENRPSGNEDIYVYNLTDGVKDISNVGIDFNLYNNVKDKHIEALINGISRSEHSKSTPDHLVVLSGIPEGFTHGWSLDHWYKAKLTAEQRSFVDKSYERPVRLRGPAGTGKTLALIVKLLRDAYIFDDAGQERRLLFVTHSGATVQLVKSIAEDLDSRSLIENKSHVFVKICTLYELAYEYLAVPLHNITPLDLDAAKGRKMQGELVTSVLKERRLWLATKFGDAATPSFVERLLSDAPTILEGLIQELSNEFATVLDAEGIRSDNDKAQKYITGSRQPWMMKLEKEGERRIVLGIHRYYRDILKELNVVSIDHLAAEYVSFLQRNLWDSIKHREGFDLVFVDEMHLFNKIERIAFPFLLREGAFGKGARPIFMAYDLKQSTRDYFSSIQGEDERSSAPGAWIGANVGISDLVELKQVFRYSTEIGEFLQDITSSFPTIDIFDEWNIEATKYESNEIDNPVRLIEFKSDIELYNWAFESAHRKARELGQGRRVGVLCINEERFRVYERAGTHRSKFLSINSRDEISEIRFCGKRFIYSIPDFVAGLQFDCVYVLHLDNEAFSLSSESPLLRRQYVSRAYLAASRASREIVVCSSQEHGGPSEILQVALTRGSIRRAE